MIKHVKCAVRIIERNGVIKSPKWEASQCSRPVPRLGASICLLLELLPCEYNLLESSRADARHSQRPLPGLQYSFANRKSGLFLWRLAGAGNGDKSPILPSTASQRNPIFTRKIGDED